jgi:DNA invertase Pin-like site-specific DNA recombinase
MLGAFAEYERAVIIGRLQGGRAAKALKGGYAYGAPPFGWRSVERELQPDDSQQAVIARIVELRSNGASTRAIAAQLEEEDYSPPRSARWNHSTVAKIVARMEPDTG